MVIVMLLLAAALSPLCFLYAAPRRRPAARPLRIRAFATSPGLVS